MHVLTDSEQKALESEISIRRVATISDYQDCEAVQLRAWGLLLEREVVPVHILRPLADRGGLVMNAYDKARRPIGTNISFLGMHNGKLILYSHMTGVVPEYQSKGVGLLLKFKQREYALERGFDLVCWTYDPMQSLNNWFNLNKLGAVSRTYYLNYYGDMPDKLNRGLESDRFLAEWWVKSPRVDSRMKMRTTQTESIQGLRIVNQTAIRDGIRPPAGKLKLAATEEALLIEVPYSYAQVREVDPAILQAWRMETRQLYSHYFSLGYFATAALIDKRGHRRSFVKIERRPLERILQS